MSGAPGKEAHTASSLLISNNGGGSTFGYVGTGSYRRASSPPRTASVGGLSFQDPSMVMTQLGGPERFDWGQWGGMTEVLRVRPDTEAQPSDFSRVGEGYHPSRAASVQMYRLPSPPPTPALAAQRRRAMSPEYY